MPISDPMREFDSRTFRRKIKSGRISDAEYREFITALPDLADKIKPRDEGGDEDGYEERLANRGRPQETAPEQAAAAPSAPAAPAPPAAVPESDSDPFAEAPRAAGPAPSPSAPVAAPSAPVVPPAASAPKTPSFDLPPLDPPTSPSAPSSGSNDDEE